MIEFLDFYFDSCEVDLALDIIEYIKKYYNQILGIKVNLNWIINIKIILLKTLKIKSKLKFKINNIFSAISFSSFIPGYSLLFISS